MLDLYNVFRSAEANDVVNFSLEPDMDKLVKAGIVSPMALMRLERKVPSSPWALIMTLSECASLASWGVRRAMASWQRRSMARFSLRRLVSRSSATLAA